MNSLLALLLLAPQDLIERERSFQRRLSPGLEFRDVRPRRASIEIEAAPDFACGDFDLRASFRALFDRNVREEFLGGALSALQAELAGSALVLACYASPTVCDAIKHYRVSANALLGMELDGCRAVEQAVDDARRRSQARAIKECLDERARRGVPLDRARQECRGASEVRGLDGRPVREIDLGRELGLPDTLVPPFRLGAGTVRAEARATAVVEAYEAKRREALEAWEAAVREPERAPLEGLGAVTRAEVERVALMEPGRREAAVRSVASAQALSALMREAHEAERTLEAAELLAAPEVREEMERRRALLRNELGRFQEAWEMERRVNAALSDAEAAASADVARAARERLAPRRAEEGRRAAAEGTRPWGCDAKK